MNFRIVGLVVDIVATTCLVIGVGWLIALMVRGNISAVPYAIGLISVMIFYAPIKLYTGRAYATAWILCVLNLALLGGSYVLTSYNAQLDQSAGIIQPILLVAAIPTILIWVLAGNKLRSRRR